MNLTRAGSLAVRRGFLTLTLTLSHSLPLYPTLSLNHSISVSLYHSFSLSLSRSFSHSLSRSNFLHNFLLMTFGTTFILIPKLKSCILTYRHIDIRTYWRTDILTCWHTDMMFSDIVLTFWTTFILIPKLKSCILTYWHTDIDIWAYWHIDI